MKIESLVLKHGQRCMRYKSEPIPTKVPETAKKDIRKVKEVPSVMGALEDKVKFFPKSRLTGPFSTESIKESSC